MTIKFFINEDKANRLMDYCKDKAEFREITYDNGEIIFDVRESFFNLGIQTIFHAGISIGMSIISKNFI